MEIIQNEIRRILTLTGKISLVPVLSLLLAGNFAGLRGFLLGLLSSMLIFVMMGRFAWKITGQTEPAYGQAVAITAYLLRMLLYALTVTVAILRPNINILAVVVGLVMIKYILIGEAMLKKVKLGLGQKFGSVEE